MIKTILFDMGGVVITLAQPQAIERFKALGLKDAAERLDAYTQQGIFGDLEAGKITDEDFRRELSVLVGRELTWQECCHAWKGYCGDVPKRNLEKMKELRDRRSDESCVESAPSDPGDKETEAISNREKEIIGLVAKGLSNKEIADRLFLSVHTVTTHRRNIASKLQIHSAAGLTIYAILHNIIDISEVSLD